MSKHKLFTVSITHPLNCPNNINNHTVKFGYDCCLDPDITCPSYVNMGYNGFNYSVKTFPENCPLKDVYEDD